MSAIEATFTTPEYEHPTSPFKLSFSLWLRHSPILIAQDQRFKCPIVQCAAAPRSTASLWFQVLTLRWSIDGFI